MLNSLTNWRTQIRKGYLELCILQLISQHRSMYGFQIIEHLAHGGLPVKEGTLYPLLSRMTLDLVLVSKWEMPDEQGRPRKYYSLTRDGAQLLEEMSKEFKIMNINFEKFKNFGDRNDRKSTDRGLSI